jgi:hypothetical protein
LFDEAMSTDVLNNLGNPLDALSRLVDFEQFSPDTGVSAVYRRAQEQSRSSAVRLRTDVQGAISSAFTTVWATIRYSIRLSTAPVFRNFLRIRDVRDVPDEKNRLELQRDADTG